LGAFASHFIKCELVVWCTTEHWRARREGHLARLRLQSGCLQSHHQQKANLEFCIFLPVQKLERCLLFLLHLNLLARGAQGEGNKRKRSYYDQQIAFYQTVCSQMHNENIRKYSVQCGCSSKWKQGAGSWWGAVLLPFFSVQGFMDVLEWVSMKD